MNLKFDFSLRIGLFFLLLISSLSAFPQIPYFAGTVGDANLYGYTSIKFRPGINAQESYTTFQYGIGSHFATGLDLYTNGDEVYGGLLVRYGLKISPYFCVGAQATPSFSINDNMKFSYLTAALYMNGNITRSGKLFWASNTWWGINRHSSNTVSQYTYLGYNIPLPHNTSITPMVGEIHSWKFDSDTDLSAGFYYTVKHWNFYLWGNDFFKSHPRVIVGVDFTLKTN